MKHMIYSLMIFMAAGVTAQKNETIIFYSKGACMGKCPVYSVTVSENGYMKYEGVMNVDKLGTYGRQLTKKEFKKLKKRFRKAKFHKLDEKYGMDVMDAALTTFKYKSDNVDKKILVKLEPPKNLKKAEAYVQELITDTDELSYEWTQISAPSSNFGRKEMPEKTIIVDLHSTVNLEEWLKKYEKYGVRQIKKIIPNKKMILVAYNPATIQFEQILKRFRQDPDVNEAEENKQIKPRSGARPGRSQG